MLRYDHYRQICLLPHLRHVDGNHLISEVITRVTRRDRKGHLGAISVGHSRVEHRERLIWFVDIESRQ